MEFDPSHSSLPSDTQRPQGPRSKNSIQQPVPPFQSWCRWTEWSRKALEPRGERRTGREVNAGPTWLTVACPSAGHSRQEGRRTIDPKAKEETGFQGPGCAVNTATGPGDGEVMGESTRVCGVLANHFRTMIKGHCTQHESPQITGGSRTMGSSHPVCHKPCMDPGAAGHGSSLVSLLAQSAEG